MPQTATSCGGTRSRWVSTSAQNPMTTAATPLASGMPAPNALTAQNVVQASAPGNRGEADGTRRAWLAKDQNPAIPADAASATGKGTGEGEVSTTVSGSWPLGQVEHAGDAHDDAGRQRHHLEGPCPSGHREPADRVLGRADQGKSSEEHDDASGDDEGGADVDVPGEQEDGDPCGERGPHHLLEEDRQAPSVEQAHHLLDHGGGQRRDEGLQPTVSTSDGSSLMNSRTVSSYSHTSSPIKRPCSS
jgi:hypothetical protein